MRGVGDEALARESVVPVARFFSGVKLFQVTSTFVAELMSKVKVVDDVRHVHRFTVERVIRRGRADPQVPGNFLHEHETGDGAPRADDALLHIDARRKPKLHVFLLRRLYARLTHRLRRWHERVHKLRQPIHRARTLVKRVLALALVHQNVGAVSENANRGVSRHDLRHAKLFVHHAINLREQHARLRPGRVLFVHREPRGFVHGLEPLTPRTPRRVEIHQHHRVRRILHHRLQFVQIRDLVHHVRVPIRGPIRLLQHLERLLVPRHPLLGARRLLVARLEHLVHRSVPLQRPDRSHVRVDRPLKHRLREIEPIQSQGVADVHARELARQRGKRKIKVDSQQFPIHAPIHHHLGVERARRVTPQFAEQQKRHQHRGEDGYHAPAHRALRHVAREFAIKVYASKRASEPRGGVRAAERGPVRGAEGATAAHRRRALHRTRREVSARRRASESSSSTILASTGRVATQA